jgi:hypothetical protein
MGQRTGSKEIVCEAQMETANNIESMLKTRIVTMSNEFVWVRSGLSGSCEHINEPRGSIQGD